ncbi:PqqD family protein [Embleya sp. NPDC020630]|uniref:PqqD family protein n=1 Tax=Embleya sp. NPDC020630 TaxID=3363979 RepID=UPI00378E562E
MLSPAPGLGIAQTGDGIAILDIRRGRTGAWVFLDADASRVWTEITRTGEIRGLVDALAREAGEPVATFAPAVRAVVDDLIARRLVRERPVRRAWFGGRR